jgi:hypothetical protein
VFYDGERRPPLPHFQGGCLAGFLPAGRAPTPTGDILYPIFTSTLPGLHHPALSCLSNPIEKQKGRWMMKKKMRNVLITMTSLVLLVWVAACAETNGMMDKGMDSDMHGKMDKPMNSMLMGSDGHHASGRVSVGMEMNRHVLTLSDIEVDKVPDGVVYLTRNADRMHGVALGALKQFSGTVSFDLPAGVNPDEFDSVVIWCRQFNVEIGRAYFSEKMMYAVIVSG